MTKSDLFKAAHKIARETKAIAGSYRIAFACALKDLYAGIAAAEEAKSAFQIAFEHFAECGKVYTYRNGDEAVFVRPEQLGIDAPRRIKQNRINVVITCKADGSYEASYSDAYNSGCSTIARAIEAMFAA